MGNVNMDSSQIHYKKSAEYNNVESALTQALQNGSEVSIAQTVTSGTELATVTIDGEGTKIYAPTIPPTKHLEWVTVASGTEGDANAVQLTALSSALANLTDIEKNNCRLRHDKSILHMRSNTGIFTATEVSTSAFTIYSARLTDIKYFSVRGEDSEATFTELTTEISSTAWELQVLRLVDNV